MPSQLNYKHLHYFWIIAREGSLVAASKVLHLAPQTLSGQLAELESALGGLLFTRRGRKLEVTPLGKIVYNHAEEMFRIGEDLKRATDLMTSNRSIPLAAGISASIHKLLAYRLLEPALELDRKVHLTCQTASTDYLLEQLNRYQLDLVLTDRVPSIKREQHLHWYQLTSSTLSLFASAKLAGELRHDFPLSLDQQPFVASTLDLPYFNQLLQWFDNQDIKPAVQAEVDDSALMKVFGSHGMGIFAAPTIIADEVCRQYQVTCIGEVNEVKETLFAICRNRFSGNPAVEAICRGYH